MNEVTISAKRKYETAKVELLLMKSLNCILKNKEFYKEHNYSFNKAWKVELNNNKAMATLNQRKVASFIMKDCLKKYSNMFDIISNLDSYHDTIESLIVYHDMNDEFANGTDIVAMI